MMQTKLQQLQDALRAGDSKLALGIARKFFFGLSESEKAIIERAYDANYTNPQFYKQIGYDAEKVLGIAITTLWLHYLPLHEAPAGLQSH